MNALADTLAVALTVLGALFVLVAALGQLRMPDLYTRMQASSKAATLGALCVVVAGALHFADGALAVRALLVCFFLALTAPVGAHVIARAGHRSGVRMRDADAIDEMGGAAAPRSNGPGKGPIDERASS